MLENKEKLIIRLTENCIDQSFLDTINSFRPLSLTIKQVKEIVRDIPDNIKIYAIKEGNSVVACGTIMIEQKIIHDGGKVAHLEDIAVRHDKRGIGYGKEIVKCLIDIAKSQGCYKAILNCNESVEKFYINLGFAKCADQMRYNFGDFK